MCIPQMKNTYINTVDIISGYPQTICLLRYTDYNYTQIKQLTITLAGDFI